MMAGSVGEQDDVKGRIHSSCFVTARPTAAQAARRSLLTLAERRSCRRPGLSVRYVRKMWRVISTSSTASPRNCNRAVTVQRATLGAEHGIPQIVQRMMQVSGNLAFGVYTHIRWRYRAMSCQQPAAVRTSRAAPSHKATPPAEQTSANVLVGVRHRTAEGRRQHSRSGSDGRHLKALVAGAGCVGPAAMRDGLLQQRRPFERVVERLHMVTSRLSREGGDHRLRSSSPLTTVQMQLMLCSSEAGCIVCEVDISQNQHRHCYSFHQMWNSAGSVTNNTGNVVVIANTDRVCERLQERSQPSRSQSADAAPAPADPAPHRAAP